MKLTKFVHSCVLVEHEGKAVLLDPGIFSWNSGLVKVDELPTLTATVVTHMHGDHLAEPFVEAIVAAQPKVQWIAPADTHEKLKQLGATNVTDQSTAEVQVTTVEHAKVVPFGAQPCQNLVVNIFDTVTSPGDTHDFNQSKEILLLPVQAPWGTTVRAFELALELKPKYILPIHDWMWNEDWRGNVYDRLEEVFKDTKANVIRPVDGQTVEVAV